jgi:hypothetical protein
LGSSHSASVRLATKEPEKGSLVSTRCYSLGSSAANLTEDLQQWPLAGNSGSGHCRRLLLLAVVVDLWWPSATIHSTASDAEIRMIIDPCFSNLCFGFFWQQEDLILAGETKNASEL